MPISGRRTAAKRASPNEKPAWAARRRMLPNDRREQIITEAIAFFTEHGFKGTTRQLSEQIGITQPLLYKYFPAKQDLIDAVYDWIYVRRIKPHWPDLIIDRRLPISERMTQFYVEYADVVLTREWVRLFVFAGLQGEDHNSRYLKQLERTIIKPMLDEIVHTARLAGGAKARVPSMDDIWAHHGSVFYFGIREHIYGFGAPSDRRQVIVDAVARFLSAYVERPRAGRPSASNSPRNSRALSKGSAR